MIFYFSGTGNSEWVAKEIAAKLGDEAVDIIAVRNQTHVFGQGDRVGIVYPVYAWAPPEVVIAFAKKIKINGAFVFSICTYGGEPGHAMKLLNKAVHLDSTYGLLMPNNYVIGMSVDSEELAKNKIDAAKSKLVAMVEALRKKEYKNEVVPGAMAGLKSSLAAAAFNQFGRNTKPFRTLSSCNGCGLCETLCPAKTITMVERKPVWSKACYQCLACINRCPQQAIEYGKVSVGKGRYYFLKNCSTMKENAL